MASAIPRLDLTCDPKTLEPGSEQWKSMSRRVFEAMETHGFLVVDYKQIAQEEVLKEMSTLFTSAPEETRRKPRPPCFTNFYPDATGTKTMYENIGALNTARPDMAKAFTDTMWPQGNQPFCDALQATSKKMLDLHKTVLDMICDGVGVGLDEGSFVRTEETLTQMIKYAAPMTDEAFLAATEHVDGSLLTILFTNEVDGLHVKSRSGEWHTVKLGGSSLAVFAGHYLRAWSNGRLYAAPHKVEYSGYKDRFTFGVFLKPEEDQIIRPHPHFVNDERPPLFRPFVSGEFLRYLQQGVGVGDNALELYAPPV